MRYISCASVLLTIIFLSANANPSQEGLLFNVRGIPTDIYIHTTIPNHYYPAAGIKLNTPDYKITSGCTTIANGYCLFGVSDTQQATITTSGSGQRLNLTLCLDGKTPASCQHYTQHAPIFSLLYVTNGNSIGDAAVLLCPIQLDGSLSECQETGGGSTHFSHSSGIVLNTEQSFAYIVNSGSGTLVACPIQSNGLFGTCFPDTPFSYSYGGLAINNSGNTLFVANYISNYVGACPIHSDGSLGTCVDSGVGTAPFDSPTGLALNPNINIVYVVNDGGNSIVLCAVSGGTFTSCVDSGLPFDGPENITINEAGNIAYIPQHTGNNVLKCTLNTSTGAFLSCTPTVSGLNRPWSIALDESIEKAYIANSDDNSVDICTIQSDGSLIDCISSLDPRFAAPAGTALFNNFLD
jgi:DNA-binding beta-propeller fold protein YncE